MLDQNNNLLPEKFEYSYHLFAVQCVDTMSGKVTF